jgi:hypothetical protein
MLKRPRGTKRSWILVKEIVGPIGGFFDKVQWKKYKLAIIGQFDTKNISIDCIAGPILTSQTLLLFPVCIKYIALTFAFNLYIYQWNLKKESAVVKDDEVEGDYVDMADYYYNSDQEEDSTLDK